MNAVAAERIDAEISTRLTILYDERCAVCRRARDWLLTQPCLVPVELLAAGSDEAQRRYRGLPWLGEELVAVDEHGNAWIGPSAFLASMWATARYRRWAFTFSRPRFAPYAEGFFHWVSDRRGRWSARMTGEDQECTWCETSAPICDNGHPLVEGDNFCQGCGAPRTEGLEFLPATKADLRQE